jgi:hypothetical protein
MKTEEIFDLLLDVMVNKLDFGYAVGLGYQAIADKGTPLARPYLVSDNFVQCQIKLELKKQNIELSNKVIKLFLKIIKDTTEIKYIKGERESFKTYYVPAKDIKLHS